MFNTNAGYSLADIAAATGGNRNGAFGDDGSWWIILLFLFAFGGFGNNGWGNGGGATTREEVAYGFDMNGLENGVRGIQQGLCDGFYAMNTGVLTGFNGVQNTLCQGFSGVNGAINSTTADIIQTINADTIANMQNTNAINAGLTALGTQMAECCCTSRYEAAKNFADLSYAIADQSCQTRQAIADSTRSIIDFLTQDKIATLTAENQSLKFAASQAAQNNFLVSQLKDPCPIPAYIVANPNCCYDATRAFGSFCG